MNGFMGLARGAQKKLPLSLYKERHTKKAVYVLEKIPQHIRNLPESWPELLHLGEYEEPNHVVYKLPGL